MEQFIISVIKLREAQKNFELDKTKVNLEAKIFWEMDIDSHLKRIIKFVAKSDLQKAKISTLFL